MSKQANAVRLERYAGLTPASLNREARTVEVVALSGYAPFTRANMPAPDGSPAPWIEELDATGAELQAFTGAPLLRDHRPSTDHHVGAVVESRIEPGAAGPQIVSLIRFSAKPAAGEMFDDVAAGILRGVSLGYDVTAWQHVGQRGGVKVFRATRWRPFELSLTPRPADAGALIRSSAMAEEYTPCKDCATPGGCKKLGGCVREADATGKDGAPPPAAAAGGDGTPPPAPDAGNRSDRGASMTRAAMNGEIRGLVRASNLPAAVADTLIDAGATVEQAQARCFSEMQRRGVFIRTEGSVSIAMGESGDDPAVRRRHMATALAARLAPGLVKPDDAARPYMGYRSLDMAGELATLHGERVNRFDQEALFRAATHTTSDFPLLLQDAGNKILLAAYQAADPSYRKWAAPRPFKDFKAHKFLRVGDFPSFKKLSESGDFKYGTLSENRESVTADEYASGLSIGRKALMNDDLSALSDFSSMIAVRAAADENKMVYGAIAGNGPVMSDGKALFHADHGNKAAAGAAIGVVSAAAARAAMRKQTSLDGIVLNISAAFLVVGPDKELEARQLVAAITATKASDANPWSGAFEVVVDANITGNRWHLFANPGQFPTVIYGYVSGNDGPQILTERDFDTGGVKVRAGLDFGFGAIDHRGAYLNEGA